MLVHRKNRNFEALVKSIDKKQHKAFSGDKCREDHTTCNYNVNGIRRAIKVKGQKPIAVTSFKYLGAIVLDEGSNRRLGNLMDYTSHCSFDEAETNMER